MGDQFGDDADGDLRHRLRADVEAERGVDLLAAPRRETPSASRSSKISLIFRLLPIMPT